MKINKLHSSAPRAAVSRLRAFGAAVSLLAVVGCTTPKTFGIETQRLAPGEVPVMMGPSVRDNRTPMEAALACYGDYISATRPGRVVIGVGEIKDYTGKYSISEGNAVTQGGSLMVYSALGKLGDAITVAERYDPSIAERELGYTDRRQLGDGNAHDVNGQRVPWLPYFGGTITGSDYFIVGGITELNYNIRSGGAEAGVNNIGFKARTFNQSVSVDVRIVDSRTLLVVKSVSLTKQFTGYEVGLNVFRFFGTDLFDINIGAKGQEPLQLGIRTALEEATMRLVGAATKIDYEPCLSQRLITVPDLPADKLRGRQPAGAPAVLDVKPVPPTPAEPAPAPVVPPTGAGADDIVRPEAPQATAPVSLNAIPATGAAPSGSVIQVPFEFGDASIGGGVQALLDRIVAAAKQGGVDVTLVARDTENWDPGKRDALIDQRLSALMAGLANRGVNPGAIRVTWRPDKADTSIHRDGPGLQEIAKIRIN